MPKSKKIKVDDFDIALYAKGKDDFFSLNNPDFKSIEFNAFKWLSPAFKLYLIREFQKLKEEENSNKKLEWDLHRTL